MRLFAGTRQSNPAQHEFPNDTFAQPLIEQLLSERTWSRELTLQPIYDPESEVVRLVISHDDMPEGIDSFVVEVHKDSKMKLADVRAKVRTFAEEGLRKCRAIHSKVTTDLNAMQAMLYKIDEQPEPMRPSQRERAF